MPTDVTNQPLVVNLVYYAQSANGALTTTKIQTFEAFDPSLATQLAPLNNFLNGSMSAGFNIIWGNLRPGLEAYAVSVFSKNSISAGHSATNINPSFPASGTVLADTSKGTATQPGQLALSYVLNGCDISFDTGSITAEWDVSFDATVTVTTPVPLLPLTLTPVTNLVTSNADLNADNFAAGWDDFWSDIGTWLTFGIAEDASDRVEGSVDGSYSPSDLSQIGDLLDGLNSAGTQLLAYGFSQCWFSIENGNTLTLTIEHPQDPGPIVIDPNSTKGVLTDRTLAPSDSQTSPGDMISVLGTGFPIDEKTVIVTNWANTSTGTPAFAQIKYEEKGTSSATPIDVSMPSPFNGEYTYPATGLKPATTYEFWARCADTLTWSAWSKHPLTVTTMADQIVHLIMRPAANPAAAGVEVGSSSLSLSSTDWNCQATIPGNTAYGTYTLTAELAGAALASTTIDIEELLTLTLVMIDKTHNTVIEDPILSGGSPFTVRGEDFGTGQVNLTLNGTTVATPTPVNGTFTQDLTVPGSPDSESQLITVDAIIGGLSASLSFTTIAPPK